MAALPVAEKEGIVLLSPTTSTPLLTGKKDMFFRVQGSSALSGSALGKFALTLPGIKKILIIQDIDNKAYSEPYKKSFLESFLKGSGREIMEIQFSSRKAGSWGKRLKDIEEHGVDSVFIIASSRATASIIQELKKQEKEKIILCCSWSATEALIRHGGRSVEGVYLAKSGFVDKTKKDYQEFFKKYKKRFGKKPSFAADQGYHALKILAHALNKTGGKSKGLARELSGTRKFKSFHGDLRLDEYGDANMPVSILKVKDAEFLIVLEIE